MTSSMPTGERRWTSSGRRGGMTVIGKVVVPKPINLPSQRLENHGLDPNVEIVPKGTFSWGGKSPSTASNPWGSSTLSSNTDGDGGSPSHLSGRPSSGGSGTRPSTANSDRAYEPLNNARGQNSRPSSASESVTSNRTTLPSLRPRSAETRPGSSLLSRFAESSPESSGAWGGTGTAEKLGVASSRNDGFSLATGDFPTLGAEKDNSEKNIESQDHESYGYDRPGSSTSSGVQPAKERNVTSIDGESSVSANVKSDNANSWKRENPAYEEDGMRPGVERWHSDPQPYPNANIRPHHYEAWRGPPVNNPPGGVWYRGPPGAPPYGNPVPPGGFPMEPFPYFHPQMHGSALANPQPDPPSGAGPRGHHPKNRDMYRPHMPDAYIRPGMPIRPGFYRGPVPYDGYYGPPMGYCNSSERDVPFMGVGIGPAVYDRHSGQNGPNPGSHHVRSDGYSSTGKVLVPEHDDPGHPRDKRGPYKVLLKQHNDQKWEGSTKNTATCNEKGEQPRPLEENEWGADHKDEGINPRKKVVGDEASYQTSDSRVSHSVSSKVNLPESMADRKGIDAVSVKKSEPALHPFPESQQPLLASPEGSSLIQKIEGLNAKARDARHDVSSGYNRDEHRNKPQVAKVNHSTNEAGSGSIYHGRSHSHRISTLPSQDDDASVSDRNLESTNGSGVVISRKSHVMQGRTDHRGKGRINGHEGDARQKISPVVDYPNKVSAVQFGTSSTASMQDHHTPMLVSEKSVAYPQMKDEREIGGPVFDSNDPERAKKKELAQQRLKQRQKEEEERISRQKANARAKLEELNRRAQNRRAQEVDGSSYNSGPIQNSKAGAQGLVESVTVTSEFEGPSPISHPNLVSQINESNTGSAEGSTFSSSDLVRSTSESAPMRSVMQNLSVPAQSDAQSGDAYKATSEVLNGGMSNQKHAGYRQKQKMFPEKSATEKVSSIPEVMKLNDEVPASTIRSAEGATNESTPNIEPSLPESSMHQRRKNKSAKHKHKVEAVPSPTSLPSPALKETIPANVSIENDKSKPQEPEVLPSSLQPVIASEANQSSDQHSTLINKESHVRVNNLSRSHPRRAQRNTQINRVAEKVHSGDAVVWAPIRSHSRAEDADGSSEKTIVDAVTSSVKRDLVQNNNAKNKRAEIEIYVPKPVVAKELAQLGTIQQPVVPSFNQATSDEAVKSADSNSQRTAGRDPANSYTEKVGFTIVHTNVDGRQNKPGKTHGSWRQRGASEPVSVEGLHDGLSHTSNSIRNVQRSVEYQHPKKAEESSEKEQPKLSDSVPVVKDQGVMGRRQHQPFRGFKSRHDTDHKKISSGDTPKIDQTNSTLDGRGAGEHSVTHWQPKSQALSSSDQLSVQPGGGGQNSNVEVSRGKKKESVSRSGMLLPSQHIETCDVMAQPHHDHHDSVKSSVEVTTNVGHQEAKREIKTADLKGNPNLPNKVSVGPSEPPSSINTDIRQGQRPFSGFRKNVHQNRPAGRGHDSRGEWSSAGQVNRQHNQPANRERQRQNSHYEYQPVGPYNNNTTSGNVEGPNGGSQSTMDARFRERGQRNLRRGGGNFYGRPSDSVRVDAGHE